MTNYKIYLKSGEIVYVTVKDGAEFESSIHRALKATNGVYIDKGFLLRAGDISCMQVVGDIANK